MTDPLAIGFVVIFILGVTAAAIAKIARWATPDYPDDDGEHL